MGKSSLSCVSSEELERIGVRDVPEEVNEEDKRRFCSPCSVRKGQRKPSAFSVGAPCGRRVSPGGRARLG